MTMHDRLHFEGKVAIITGAGQGLGRQHALLLASRGARVVVNDVGGDLRGGGYTAEVADQVVDLIRHQGGQAVASYDSVLSGEKIVETALATWGTLDIVVNNAGILRDSSFHKMTHEDWEQVLQVHLHGCFRVTRAAWHVLREKGYGRIIMTTSAAGIYGNFGQANYAAAKMGIIGLAQSLAIEGRSRQIHVNCIAPIAGSRMTETILPAEVVADLKPEYVSSLVAWLCHADCMESGSVFEVGAGYFSKLRWERSEGLRLPLAAADIPEALVKSWPTVLDFSASDHPESAEDAFAPVLKQLRTHQAN